MSKGYFSVNNSNTGRGYAPLPVLSRKSSLYLRNIPFDKLDDSIVILSHFIANAFTL